MPKAIMSGRLRKSAYYEARKCQGAGEFGGFVTQSKHDEDGKHATKMLWCVARITYVENVETGGGSRRIGVFVYAPNEEIAQQIAVAMQVVYGTDAEPEDDEKKESDYADVNEFNEGPRDGVDILTIGSNYIPMPFPEGARGLVSRIIDPRD